MPTTNRPENPETSVDSFSDVQSHGDVCGNCFRRTHYTFERNYAIDTVKVDDFEWELWARPIEAPDRSYPVDENRTQIPAENPSGGIRGTCKCGYPSGEQLRPLPKTLFLRYALHLLYRYDEFGVSVDARGLFDELKERKSEPSEQFADDCLYAEVTEKYRC